MFGSFDVDTSKYIYRTRTVKGVDNNARLLPVGSVRKMKTFDGRQAGKMNNSSHDFQAVRERISRYNASFVEFFSADKLPVSPVWFS